jgi:predicted transposase/invertase (TIGR01784 family)
MAHRPSPFTNLSFNRKQQTQYEKSLKYYRDLKNVTDTAFFEGHEEGKEEGIEIGIEIGREEAIKQTAKNLKAIGLDNQSIAKATGLSVEDVESL